MVDRDNAFDGGRCLARLTFTERTARAGNLAPENRLTGQNDKAKYLRPPT